MAEGLPLLIEPELDERAATATMNRAQRIYTDGARDISRQMREQLTEGAREGGRAIERMADDARRAYDRMGEATQEAERAERQLQEARDRGAADVNEQSQRVVRARREEEEAIREAARAYDEYAAAAQRAGNEGGESFTGGMRGAIGQAGGLGREFADGFAGGFAGAGIASRLAGFAIPGAGWVAAGVAAGAMLAQGVVQGMESLRIKDLFQARLGVDEATMARYGQAAAGAYTQAWGSSVEDNLRSVQFAIQGGVIGRDASDDEIQQTIANMQALAQIMEVDVSEAARAAGQLIRGGFAQDGQQAADIIASGFQRGLDIAGDWLDTITEYTTQFRKLGLDGDDALGLIQQGLEGGARDSDKVADSLKEFSIRAVDGSKLTAEGFAALGFSADEMAAKFLAGGDSARSAFGATLNAIKSLQDPVEQALVWQALFGTQWEDMGNAINSMDLSNARAQFADTEGSIDSATSTLSNHVSEWDLLGRNIDIAFTKLKEWLADSTIGKFLTQGFPGFFNDLFFPGQHGPASYTNPDAAPPIPLSPTDVASGTIPGFPGGGAPVRSGPGDLLLPSLGGPGLPAGNIPAAAPPAGDAPVPGQRTPMLTDTQKAAADAAKAGTSLPSAPQVPLQYTSTAGLPTQVANAVTRLDEARHAVAEKQARVNQLEQTNVATADDIQKAKNDLIKAEKDRQQAEQALVDAQIKAADAQGNALKGSSSALQEFGAALDSDFGISKGLAGIVENMVRLIGNIAAAPALAALGAVSAARGDEGSGLMGILASTGALGPQFMPSAFSASAMGPAAFGGGLGGPVAGGGPFFAAQPGQSARDFAHNTMMPFWQSLGLTVGDHAADAFGEHQNGALDIMVPDIATGYQVLQQVLSDPNVYGAIFNQRSYGYGRGPGGTPMGDRGSPTQNHMDHVHVFYKPGGSNNIVPGGISIPSTPAAPAAPYSQSPGASGPGWFPALPPGITGGRGESPVFGPMAPAPGGAGGPGMLGRSLGGPGIGAGLGLPGQSFPAMGGEGGVGVGGMAMDALMAGTSGLDMLAPGAGAAAKIGIQVINRSIKYAGQMAGIATNFWLSALTPAGENPKASIGNSWFGKLIGGIAGAKPALPNLAGGKPPGAMGQEGQQGQQPGQPVTNNLTINNNHATEDFTGNQAVRELGEMYAPAGRQ